MAPPLAWILATITAIAYVLYTMKAIPLVAKQREISWFKLLGILSAVVGGIVEEVFFRRWIMDMLMSGGFIPSSRSLFPASHLVWPIPVGHSSQSAIQGYASGNHIDVNSRDTFLAIIYLAGGRNLGPCIFAHVLINIVIEPWLMLSAVSGKWRTQHRSGIAAPLLEVLQQKEGKRME